MTSTAAVESLSTDGTTDFEEVLYTPRDVTPSTAKTTSNQTLLEWFRAAVRAALKK